MADISQELSQIKNSVYGKTMRTAIHDAIKKVNEDGGGGGGATITQLWSSPNGAVTETEYTLADSINNYDVIYLKVGTDTDISGRQAYDYTSFLTSMYTTGEEVAWEGFHQRYLRVIFNGNKFTQTISDAINEDLGYRPKVRAIVGIKY